MARPLLVGESNPYGADPFYALYPRPTNASGGRLARILGLTEDEYLERFDRTNLCAERWKTGEARQAADFLLREGRYTRFILLGCKVACAFGVEGRPYCLHHLGRTGVVVATLPHPSGQNRLWHEKNAKDRARHTLERITQRNTRREIPQPWK